MSGYATISRRSLLFGAAMSLSVLPVEAKRRKSRVLLVAGQSFVSPWNSAYMRREFVATRKKYGDTSTWYFVVSGFGSSAAMKPFAEPSQPNNYWYNLETNTPGPCLLDTIDTINSKKSLPTEILWVHGQQEGRLFVRGMFGWSDETFKHKYKMTVLRIASVLRSSIGSGKIPFYVQIVGTRADGDTYGDVLIREAQLELISEYGKKHNIRLGAVQPFSLPLKDGVHPDPNGNRILAQRNARAVD